MVAILDCDGTGFLIFAVGMVPFACHLAPGIIDSDATSAKFDPTSVVSWDVIRKIKLLFLEVRQLTQQSLTEYRLLLFCK